MAVEQIEKAKQEVEEAMLAEEAAQAEADETVVAEQTEIKEDDAKKTNEWWHKNFLISFDFNPVGFAGSDNPASNAMKMRGTLQRHGNVLRITSQQDGSTVNTLYKIENDSVVKYLYNPDNKKAFRSIPNQKHTIDDYVKNQLSQYTLLPTKNPVKSKEYEMAGKETIAGRSCEKWIAEKNIFGNITRATIWLDAEHRFALKSNTYLKLDKKETSGDPLIVTEVSFSPDPKEALIDFSEYELISQ